MEKTKRVLIIARDYCKVRAQYAWNSPVVKNACFHSLTVLLLYSISACSLILQMAIDLITYPVTLLVAQENQDTTVDPTVSNYCGGLLLSLLQQGAILNSMFLPSSLGF